MSRRPDFVVLITIVVAQFCGTSLWFATNAILPQLQVQFGWSTSSLGFLTAGIQLGFISGTMLFAVYGIADKFSPSKVFLVSCISGALFNTLSLLNPSSFGLTLTSRLMTGFFLAGIYPVGMKIASDYRKEGLGNWLGGLVGALVLGTAFPHAMKLLPLFNEFDKLIMGVSLVALVGGLLLFLLVPDGPHRNNATPFDFSGIREGFKIPEFRAAAFGYFGHMWELYAFWAFVPFIVKRFNETNGVTTSSSLPFIVIAMGAVGCVAGGLLSRKTGSYKVAWYALITSGLCCVFSPWILEINSNGLYIVFMLVWGSTVVADSPQFSALVARHAPSHVKGSAITIVTSVGFSITIISIQLLSYLQDTMGNYLTWILVPGPMIGIILMWRNK